MQQYYFLDKEHLTEKLFFGASDPQCLNFAGLFACLEFRVTPDQVTILVSRGIEEARN